MYYVLSQCTFSLHRARRLCAVLLGTVALLFASPIWTQQNSDGSASGRFDYSGFYISIGGDYTAQRKLDFTISNSPAIKVTIDSEVTSHDSSGTFLYSNSSQTGMDADYNSMRITQNEVGAQGLDGALGRHFDSGMIAELEIGYVSTDLSATYNPQGKIAATNLYEVDDKGVEQDPFESCANAGYTEAECEAFLQEAVNELADTVYGNRTNAQKVRAGRFSELSAIANLGMRVNSDSRIKPFVMGGIGLVSQRLSLDPLTLSATETDTLTDYGQTVEIKDDIKFVFPRTRKTNTSLGYQLKAGVEIEFSPRVAGVVAARYRGAFSDSKDFKISSGGDGLSFSAGIQLRF